MKSQVLNIISPFIKYGLEEAKDTSYVHALQEIAAIIGTDRLFNGRILGN
ncbi:hypothetical protein M3210_19050 [Oceanobacillus luteolus]|uniref:Uncharacterized protein n=1 Tax=Oceanobacillus luteolus TaxID=1274358 RepID=A0ABW4HNQ8_9BACI|nr:hypothetical protein [Oceanobacillus luteolus]